MASIDTPPRPAVPAKLKDRFEELRAAFQRRLTNDRIQLLELRARCEPAAALTAALHEEIRRFAHTMAGAAAVFEAADVSSLAQSVEELATYAGEHPGLEADTAVRNAIDALLGILPAP